MNENNQTNEFNFESPSPAEVAAKRKKLITISITLGGMVGLILLVVVGFISYSWGYNKGKDDGIAPYKKLFEQQSSSKPENTNKLADSTATYQSQDIVGEGQIPDHYRGNKNAKITAIEFADYTCSYCAQLAQDGINDVYNKYGDKVRFIYRHYNVGHTYSDVSAKIAEAAYLVGGEGAFWNMSDKLFNDETWLAGEYMDTNALNEKIRELAKQINLDGQSVLDAYNNSADNGIQAKIERDRKLADDSNINGTPSWFINGQMVNGGIDGISKKLDELTK